MTTTSNHLLMKFRSKDAQFGTTRGTVKADVNETQVIHMALPKLTADVLPAYAPDDGPLAAPEIKVLRNDAAKHMPKGNTLSKVALFSWRRTGAVIFQSPNGPSSLEVRIHGLRTGPQ